MSPELSDEPLDRPALAARPAAVDGLCRTADYPILRWPLSSFKPII
jgi:hypothetical protein